MRPPARPVAHRHGVSLISSAIGLAALSAFAVTPLSARPVGDRPNVIVVLLDDSGFGDMAHTGATTTRTPNVSRMVAEGATFPQFYCASPACSASRYGLLTGRNPMRSGLGGWVIGPDSRPYLHPREVTLAEGLKSRGYATGFFGKWHLGSPNAKNGFAVDSLPLAHGFDRWYGTNVSHDYPGVLLLEGPSVENKPVPGYRIVETDFPDDAAIVSTLTRRYTDRAVSFIKERKDEPFLLYLAFNMPHLGVYPNKDYAGKSRRGAYGDVMEEMDDSIGCVRKALEESGVDRNTLVIISSDNGPWIMFENTEKGRYGEARLLIGSALPFRDGKGSTWEGGMRVPGVMWWPGVIPAARVVDAPASLLDVLPTVFGFAGVELPKDRTIDGRDIRPLLDAKLAPGVSVPEFKFIYPGNGPTGTLHPMGIRHGAWKLAEYTCSQAGLKHGYEKVSPEKPLLFQVEQDPSEKYNRAKDADKAEVVARLHAELAECIRRIREEGAFADADPKFVPSAKPSAVERKAGNPE